MEKTTSKIQEFIFQHFKVQYTNFVKLIQNLTPKYIKKMVQIIIKNHLICKHSIWNYMRLSIICYYVLSFLQLITIL